MRRDIALAVLIGVGFPAFCLLVWAVIMVAMRPGSDASQLFWLVGFVVLLLACLPWVGRLFRRR